MQRIFPIIATCLTVLLLASCSQNLTISKKAAVESKVLAVHDQMIKAAEALDTEKMFHHILDSEETVIQNNDRIENRQQAMQSVSKSFEGVRILQYHIEERQVAVLSPTMAEMTVKGKSLMITDDNRVFTTPFSQTLRFVLTDGEWKIQYAIHITEEN
jgi:uncharacterized protein YlxW (UPF0749 family)